MSEVTSDDLMAEVWREQRAIIDRQGGALRLDWLMVELVDAASDASFSGDRDPDAARSELMATAALALLAVDVLEAAMDKRRAMR